jgi:hypothetical protein
VTQTQIESAEIILRTPGSYKSNDTSVIWQQYPAYNEALGVIAVLQRPAVSGYTSVAATTSLNGPPFINDYLTQYKLDSLKLKFNPAAEIDFERTKIYGAYLMNIPSSRPKVGDFYKNIGFQASGPPQFITDFFPLGCLKDVFATVHIRDTSSIDVGSPYVPVGLSDKPKLRLLIDYYSKPNRYGVINHTMQVITLETDVDFKSLSGADPTDVNNQSNIILTPRFTEHPDIVEIEDTVFTQTDTIRAWSQIFLKGNISTASGVKVVFIAPNIDMSATSSFDPNLEFIAQALLPCQKPSRLVEVSDDEIISFCNSNQYVANRSLHKRAPILPEEKKVKVPILAAKVYPNPTASEFFIEIQDEMHGEINIVVMDYLGKVIDSMRTTEHQLKIDLSGNTQGVYFIKIFNDKNSSTSKLILTH